MWPSGRRPRLSRSVAQGPSGFQGHDPLTRYPGRTGKGAAAGPHWRRPALGILLASLRLHSCFGPFHGGDAEAQRERWGCREDLRAPRRVLASCQGRGSCWGLGGLPWQAWAQTLLGLESAGSVLGGPGSGCGQSQACRGSEPQATLPGERGQAQRGPVSCLRTHI